MNSTALRRGLHNGHSPNYSEKIMIRKELTERAERGFVSPIRRRHIEGMVQETAYRCCDWNKIRAYLRKPMPNC